MNLTVGLRIPYRETQDRAGISLMIRIRRSNLGTEDQNVVQIIVSFI
jgi:hypothetical protein